MSADAAQWARLVLERFEDLGLTTDRKIGEAKGPSTSTLTAYRAVAEGRRPTLTKPRDDVFDRVDRAARWPAGTARKLWADPSGGQPVATVGDPTYVAAPGPKVMGTVDESEVLRAIREMQEAIKSLSERVADVEQRRP